MSDYESVQKRRDVIVGAFVITGLAALAWMILQFGDLPTAVTRMRSFQIYVQFPTAPGVMKDTPVRFCGYQVGLVTHVAPPAVRKDFNTGQLYHQTLCTLSINRMYTDIPSNVEVKLMTRGLGSSYLELKVYPSRLPAPPRDPGDPNSRCLAEGMVLQGSTGMTSEFFPEESQEKLSGLVDAIRTFVGHANDILGDPKNKENFKATLANIAETSGSMPVAIDQIVATLKDAQETLAEFRQLAAAGSDTLKSTDAKAERLVVSLVNTSNELSSTASQLRLAMEKINRGDGSAGRLLNDGRLYESLLESTTQLNVLLKDLRDLTAKIGERGLRSVY